MDSWEEVRKRKGGSLTEESPASNGVGAGVADGGDTTWAGGKVWPAFFSILSRLFPPS